MPEDEGALSTVPPAVKPSDAEALGYNGMSAEMFKPENQAQFGDDDPAWARDAERIQEAVAAPLDDTAEPGVKPAESPTDETQQITEKLHEESLPYAAWKAKEEKQAQEFELRLTQAREDTAREIRLGEATRLGFKDLEAYDAAVVAHIKEREDAGLAAAVQEEWEKHAALLGEDAANTWREAKLEALKAQEINKQSQRLNEQAQVQQLLTHVTKEIDSTLEKLPEAAHAFAREILGQSNIQYLPTLQKMLIDHDQAMKNHYEAEYAAKFNSRRDQNSPTSEGNGGTSRPAMPAQDSGPWKPSGIGSVANMRVKS